MTLEENYRNRHRKQKIKFNCAIYPSDLLSVCPDSSNEMLGFEIINRIIFLNKEQIRELSKALQRWYETGELEEKQKKVYAFCHRRGTDKFANGCVTAVSLEEAKKKAALYEPEYFDWYELKPEDAIKL